MIPFPLSCVTHSLSFPFTLLFRSRPFSPSYVPALFHFPTLCELLRTRHVFNELQVARSDSFRKSISWAFLTSPTSAHTVVCGILFYSISSLFFSSFLSFSFFLIFPFFRTARSVASVRSAHLTGPAIISLVPAWHLISFFVLVRSRPVCSLSSGPSQCLVLGSTMRITSNRNAAALLNRRPS